MPREQLFPRGLLLVRGRMSHFDIFIIRQWADCYTLEVKIARPRNAPRRKFTQADQKRMQAANKKNLELLEREFTTLEEVVTEIQQLQWPEGAPGESET